MKPITTKALTLTSVLCLSAFAASHANAEMKTEQSSEKPGYRTITTLVGYKEDTIGRLMVKGSGTDETQIPKSINPMESFDLMDKNNDQMLSKSELLGEVQKKRKSSSNLVTKTGRPVRVDYYMMKNGLTDAYMIDMTADGSMFTQMDLNKDQYITRNELEQTLTEVIIKDADFSPAAGEPMHTMKHHQ